MFGGRRGEKLTLQADKHVVSWHVCQREDRTVKRNFHISRIDKSSLECKPVHGQLRIVSGA